MWKKIKKNKINQKNILRNKIIKKNKKNKNDLNWKFPFKIGMRPVFFKKMTKFQRNKGKKMGKIKELSILKIRKKK